MIQSYEMPYLRFGENLSIAAPWIDGRPAVPVYYDCAIQVPGLRVALCGIQHTSQENREGPTSELG